jgi:pyridoxal phosphate enzyme (YggS family)
MLTITEDPVDLDAFDAIVSERMAQVERRVSDACRRAGRARSEVTIVCVTKTIPAHATRRLPGLGLRHLGENRPQELRKKATAVMDDVTWHMIGHLQRNKIELVLPVAKLIHSVDSVRLLEAIEAEAAKQDRVVSVLLEVNASGETTKHGFAPTDVSGLISHLEKLRNVQVEGLMTMAAPLASAEDCRPTFATLRELRDRLRDKLALAHPCDDLSMGMTNDFEVAIEEGATYVRLGSVYFEGLPE